MTKIIIGFTGKAGSGKDTAVNDLKSLHDESMIDHFSFASPLKNGVKEMWGFTEEQVNTSLKDEIDEKWNVTPREILQWLGTDVVRARNEHHWTQLMKNKILLSDKEIILISDVRFENEAALIKELGGLVCRVVRPSEEASAVATPAHVSEQGTFPVDYIIQNNGTLQMYRKAIQETLEPVLGQFH